MASTTTDQQAARTQLRKVAAARRAAEDGETPAVLTALRSGVRPTDIARDLDRGREFVRRIARAHGIDPDRTDPSTAAAATDVPDVPAAPTDDTAVAIAAHLRTLATVADGAAYLDTLALTRPALLAVATALQLTRVDRLSATALRARVLKQAIDARNKFAGLRSW